MSKKAKQRIKQLLWVGLVIAILVGASLLPKLIEQQLYPLRYTESVEKYAETYQVDPYFVYAVIHSESHFNPEAVSKVGASGLMQLMPDTFDWLKTRLKENRPLQYHPDVFDPEINIQYGTYMLSLLLEEFGDRDVAIMAYHAGRGNVAKWLKNPKYSADGKTIHTIPYEDTEDYVHHVNKAYQIYLKRYGLKERK